MRSLLVICIAYLLGSIPFGYLIVRVTQCDDVRETGSGGTGATNVSRRAGKTAGVLTLMLDALKGAGAVVLAKLAVGLSIFGFALPVWLGSPEPRNYWLVTAAAIAVIVGHILPVWLRFRGGKGVATCVGVFLMLMPGIVVIAVVIFVIAVGLTRYVSLGSILAAISIPAILLIEHTFIRPIDPFAPLITAALAGAALIVSAHRANIGRLIAGNENKFK